MRAEQDDFDVLSQDAGHDQLELGLSIPFPVFDFSGERGDTVVYYGETLQMEGTWAQGFHERDREMRLRWTMHGVDEICGHPSLERSRGVA